MDKNFKIWAWSLKIGHILTTNAIRLYIDKCSWTSSWAEKKRVLLSVTIRSVLFYKKAAVTIDLFVEGDLKEVNSRPSLL
jgi:hypothetical protein